MDIVQADFDEECEIATGYSFYEWMKNQTKSYSAIFNFCRRCWERESVWGKPSLVLTKDRDSQLGDQLCMKWLEIFGDDKKRIRYRKKWIRYLFRFLGRHDLCDRHLRMTKSRDPIPVRRIPEIELPNFPFHYEAAINEMAMKGFVYETAAKFKTVTQMRIGNRKEQRGLLGLRVGSNSGSYILMNGPDVFRCRVLEKKNESWDITWIPESIREALWEIYQSKNVGDPLFEIYLKEFRRTWKEAMLKHTGIEMVPHDSRKVSITWLYVNEVPLEIATTLNVGWLDLNTPREHYLHVRRLLKNTQNAVYRENIPDWFKQGLDEYV